MLLSLRRPGGPSGRRLEASHAHAHAHSSAGIATSVHISAGASQVAAGLEAADVLHDVGVIQRLQQVDFPHDARQCLPRDAAKRPAEHSQRLRENTTGYEYA